MSRGELLIVCYKGLVLVLDGVGLLADEAVRIIYGILLVNTAVICKAMRSESLVLLRIILTGIPAGNIQTDGKSRKEIMDLQVCIDSVVIPDVLLYTAIVHDVDRVLLKVMIVGSACLSIVVMDRLTVTALHPKTLEDSRRASRVVICEIRSRSILCIVCILSADRQIHILVQLGIQIDSGADPFVLVVSHSKQTVLTIIAQRGHVIDLLCSSAYTHVMVVLSDHILQSGIDPVFLTEIFPTSVGVLSIVEVRVSYP